MVHHRPLFELIVEEARSKAWDSESSACSSPSPCKPSRVKSPSKKKPKLGRWFTRDKTHTPKQDTISSQGASPTTLSTDYESAHDSFSVSDRYHGTLNMMDEDNGMTLSCLQDEGDKYLEVAVALDMMELCVVQARIERDTALAQALDLHYAIDAMRTKLHQSLGWKLG